jgi:hypothetical protein
LENDSVPTNLPERRAGSDAKPMSLATQLSGFAALLLAAVFTVVMLDQANMSYASDGSALIALDSAPQWDPLIGFPP